MNEMAYSDEEWGLLVGLPQAVLVAASAVEDDGARKTMAEGSAGMDAIAAGRHSGNPLVERVAVELIARVGDPEDGDEPLVIRPADPEGMVLDVLDRARSAAALLAGKAGDAAAYKHWLVVIAESVAGAASSGGLFGLGGDQISAAERDFVDELSLILQD